MTTRANSVVCFAKIDSRVQDGATLGSILLTHYHPDHVGGVVPTAQRYGLRVGAHAETWRRLDFQVDRFTIEDGDRFELGNAPDGVAGWALEAIETPGHAPDHLAFQESRYHALIAGDLLSSLSTVVIDPRDGHLATYLASLEKIAARPLGMVYPGHGPAVLDGPRMIETYFRHRRAREAKLKNALADGVTQLDDLLSRVYDDAASSVLHLARRSLLAALIKLEEDGIVRTDDQVSWRAVDPSEGKSQG